MIPDVLFDIYTPRFPTIHVKDPLVLLAQKFLLMVPSSNRSKNVLDALKFERAGITSMFRYKVLGDRGHVEGQISANIRQVPPNSDF